MIRLFVFLFCCISVNAGMVVQQATDSFGKLTPSALAAWYDPADNTLNGDGISAVYDKTGQGRNLLQATANNQPLISREDNKGNLLVRSEEFQTTWTLSQMNGWGAIDTGAAGAGSFANTSRTVDPLGGNTAEFVQENAATAEHFIAQPIAVLAPNTTVTLSVCVKQAGRTDFRLRLIGVGSTMGAYFNAATGVVGSDSVSGGGSVSSKTAEDLGNGWWRFSVTGAIGVVSLQVEIHFYNSALSYSGDNTSGLFLRGAQLRPASWDSDYIATVATPAIAGLNGYKTAYFDGSADYLKTAAFTLNQPTTVVLCGVKQWTWTLNDRLHDGVNDQSGALYQGTGSSPQLTMYAGSSGVSANSALAVGSFGFAASVFNTTSSFLVLNTTSTALGNAGSANMGGLTLGARSNGSIPSHIQVGQVLLYNRALDTNEVAYVGRLSNRLYNLGF